MLREIAYYHQEDVVQRRENEPLHSYLHVENKAYNSALPTICRLILVHSSAECRIPFIVYQIFETFDKDQPPLLFDLGLGLLVNRLVYKINSRSYALPYTIDPTASIAVIFITKWQQQQQHHLRQHQDRQHW